MKRKRNTFAIAAHMRVTRILICLPIGESTRINSACRWYLYFWSESDLNPFLLFSTLLLESEYSIYLRIIFTSTELTCPIFEFSPPTLSGHSARYNRTGFSHHAALYSPTTPPCYALGWQVLTLADPPGPRDFQAPYGLDHAAADPKVYSQTYSQTTCCFTIG